MNQPPLKNPDLQNDRVEKSRTVDGCPDNNIQGSANRAIQGSDNLAVQGDGNKASQDSSNLNGYGSHFIKNMQADKVVFINGIYSEVCVEEKLNNLQTTLEEEKINSKNKATFVFTGTIDIVDEKLLKALEAHLRKIAKDTELTILKAEEGSIKITLAASSESLQLLKNLFESGELTEVLNLPLEEVQIVSKDLDDNNNNELDYGRLAREIINYSASEQELNVVCKRERQKLETLSQLVVLRLLKFALIGLIIISVLVIIFLLFKFMIPLFSFISFKISQAAGSINNKIYINTNFNIAAPVGLLCFLIVRRWAKKTFKRLTIVLTIFLIFLFVKPELLVQIIPQTSALSEVNFKDLTLAAIIGSTFALFLNFPHDDS